MCLYYSLQVWRFGHSGLFCEDNTTMIVSRGVGNSIIPLRFNNRPEIVVVDLKPVA